MKKNLFFKTFDGKNLRYQVNFCQNRTVKGTFLLLHGRAESLNKYDEICETILQKGYHVVALDWRGQGLSDRPLKNRHKHHDESFAPLVRDLEKFVNEILSQEFDGPLYILAHSMGGHIALRYLVEKENSIEAAVLSAPLIGIKIDPVPGWFGNLYVKAGNILGLSKAYATPNRDWGRFEQNEKVQQALTHDKERYQKDVQLIKENPHLALGGVTFGWLAAAMDSCRVVQHTGYTDSLKTPILIAQAEEDIIVDNKVMTKLADDSSTITLKIIKGAAHEILRETDEIQQSFWSVFDEFINK